MAAKFLLLVAVSVCLAASVAGKVLRRAADFNRNVERKRSEVKQCCLPPELTLSATFVASQRNSWNSYDAYDDKTMVDFVYSASANKIFVRPSDAGGSPGAALLEVSPNQVEVKVSPRSTCNYFSMGKFRDTFFTEFVDGQLCLPEALANYIGTEQEQESDQSVDQYSIYHAEFSSSNYVVQKMTVDVKLSAMRLDDGSCLPVKVTFSSGDDRRQSDVTLALKNVSFQQEAQSDLFDSAC